jgi:capsid assembly protease
MSYPRLSTRLYNCPLMIEPGKAEVIEAVFRAYVEGRPESLPPFEAKPPGAPPVPMERTDNGYSVAAGGVAVLPIHGTLVQRADNLDAASGLTGYNRIATQFQAALDDPQVRGIVLEFDSHGGEVAGVFELAGQIMAAQKPVYAHANESAFSAAYALAVGAEQIWIAQTGMVGSIGVLMMHVDQSQADAKKGMVYTPIYAGAHKMDFSSRAPLSDAAKGSGQEQVDRLYSIFVDHVATAQGIDPQAVRDTEAGLLTPGQASDIGLANGQASLGETIQRMQASFSTEFTGYSRPSRASLQRSSIMDHPKDKTPGQVAATEDQLNAARAEGRAAAAADNAKAIADAQALAAKEAGTAAQARISGILTHAEAGGRRALAEHLAFKTAISVDDAAAMLAAAPKEAAAAPANLLAAAMNGIPNPKVGAEAGEGEETEASIAKRIAIYANASRIKRVK